MLARMIRRLRRALPRVSVARPCPLGFEPLEAREVPAVVYGITPGNVLIRFDSADPTQVTTIGTVSGLGADQTIRGIDFQPRTGRLYASAVTTASASNSVIFTYTINPLNAQATFVGQTAAALMGAGDMPIGYDFNPTVNLIRYVDDTDENARLNPFTGALQGDDTNLTGVAVIIAEAYDRNFDRAGAAIPTTLFAINRVTSSLAIQGGINGAPSPNGGVITDLAPLGFTLGGAADGGFDIAYDPANPTANGGRGVALAALTNAADSLTRLYSIDLATGAATSLGTIGAGSQEVRGLAIVPDGAVVVGSGLGANGDVRILDPDSGAVRVAVVPFEGYQGGVRVAAGDVTGDGIADAVVSANAPQGHVKVFDGITGVRLGGFVGSFFAYEGFLGNVNVASGDANGDGRADVVTIANGVDGHVKVFSGVDGTLLASFLAYPGFTGNSTVALADFDNDGDDEIVTAAAVNGHVKVFNLDGTPFAGPSGFSSSFLAYDGYLGDLNVAAGDVTGDGRADIVLATGATTRGHVKVFSGSNGALAGSFFAYPATFTGGASVGVADVNADGRFEIVVTPGLGLQADVTAFDEVGAPVGSPRTAFAGFLGGATVAGVRI